MNKLFLETLTFFKNPYLIDEVKLSAKAYLFLFISSLGIMILIIVPSLLSLSVFEESLPNTKWDYNSFSEAFVYVVILAPILEEFLFRLPLNKVSWTLILCIFLVWMILDKLFNLQNNILDLIIWVVIFFLIIYFSFFKIPSFLYLIWKSRFKYFFYFITLTFGVIHLTNYDLSTAKDWVILPLLILPQTLLGFFWAFLRLKYNIFLTVVLHSTYNLIALFINFYILP